MELDHSIHFNRIRKIFSQTLSRLQGGSQNAKLPVEAIGLLRGIGLLMTSCILAWLSVLSTREMTLVEYRESYRPKRMVWHSLLTSRGYRQVVDTDLASRLMRLRPTENNQGERPSLWISPELQSISFPPGTASEHLELWHRTGTLPAQGTSSLPYSLEGLERLASLLEQEPAPRRSVTPGRSKSIDPKEIRY